MNKFTLASNKKNGTARLYSRLIATTVIMLIFLLPVTKIFGQANLNNYSFVAANNGTLEDISVGNTVLLSGNNDDAASAVAPIGFNFIFMGVQYSYFSANSNGQMTLHTSAGASAIGSNVSTLSSNTITLAPFAGDNEVNNGISYKVTGSSPNRKLVIEWNQFYVYYTPNLANAGNMQVWLNESTGIITYIYGDIYNANSTSVTRAIFLASGNTATTAGTVTIGSPNTFATSATLVDNTIAAGSGTTTGSPLVGNIGSASDGSRTIFTFTPPAAPADPTTISFSSVGASSMDINWTDNSTNEVSFLVTRATDAGFTQNVITTTVNSTTSATTGTAYLSSQTGLVPGTTYYYKISALNEGTASAGLTGNQATNAPGVITSTGTGGNWSSTGTWAGGVVPTATDNVIIADGATVTIDNTTATCFNLTVGQGTSGILTWVGGAVAATLKVNADLTVAANGTFNAGIGTGTKSLNIGGSISASTANGNMVVDGSFDMVTSATAFVSTTFWGSANGSLSGTGATCNFHTITINKGTGISAILDITRVITAAAPTASGNRLVITNGTFKLSSASALTPYFGSQTICASTGRLWLNNAAASVQCVGTGTGTGAGSPTVTGTLQIDNGVFAFPGQ